MQAQRRTAGAESGTPPPARCCWTVPFAWWQRGLDLIASPLRVACQMRFPFAADIFLAELNWSARVEKGCSSCPGGWGCSCFARALGCRLRARAHGGQGPRPPGAVSLQRGPSAAPCGSLPAPHGCGFTPGTRRRRGGRRRRRRRGGTPAGDDAQVLAIALTGDVTGGVA